MTFDDIEIDIANYELRRSGEVVAVEPKVFDVIRFLAENANRLITKDELIQEIWDGRIVSDAALSTAIKSARRAMGETDVRESRIKTVRGRGFRLNLPGQDVLSEDASDQMRTAPEATEPTFVDPTFVVLEPHGYAAADKADEIRRFFSRSVARIPFISVVAPIVAKRLKDEALSELAHSLGYGFAFDVGGRSEGNQARLDCLLFETTGGRTVWAYETPAFAPEDGLGDALLDIATRLSPQLVRAIHDALSVDGNDPRALTMRGLGTMALRGWNRHAFEDAEATLARALSLDGNISHAHAGISLVLALGQQAGLSDPDEAQRLRAISHADRAIELDGMSPAVLGLAGCALCDAGQSMRGKSILERALSIDDGNPQAMAALGTQLFREGELGKGIEYLLRAIRFAPQDNTIAVWGSVLALALLRKGDVDGALKEARRAVAADDRTHLSRVALAAIHAARGELDLAKNAWLDSRRVTPNLDEVMAAAVIGPRAAAQIAGLADG